VYRSSAKRKQKLKYRDPSLRSGRRHHKGAHP
jgi:hypothetical protein